MRSFFLVAAISLPFGALGAKAQAASPVPLPSVPTTKVLALGHLTAAANAGTMRGVMPSEVRETVKLYLRGKIDQWFSRQDKSGVVFVMNVSTVEEARALLEKLPLGQQKLMDFDLIPLGPLSPLNFLLTSPSAPSATATPVGEVNP